MTVRNRIPFRVNKSEIFILTDGAYSDYSIRGVFQAFESFTLKEKHDEYVASLPMVPKLKYCEKVEDPSSRYGYKYVRFDPPIDTGEMRKESSSVDGFIAYLIRNNLVQTLDVRECNLDYDLLDYGL